MRRSSAACPGVPAVKVGRVI